MSLVRRVWPPLAFVLALVALASPATAGLGDPLRGVNAETFCEEHDLDLFGACVFAPGNMGAEVDGTCTGTSDTMRIIRAVLMAIGVGVATNAVIVIIGETCTGGQTGLEQALVTCNAVAGGAPVPPYPPTPQPTWPAGLDVGHAGAWMATQAERCWETG